MLEELQRFFEKRYIITYYVVYNELKLQIGCHTCRNIISLSLLSF